MKTYTLVVLTNAVSGRDADFNDWYDNVHVRDVTAVPGFVSAKRFIATSAQPSDEPVKWRYLALYTIQTDDLAGALQEMNARAGTEAMVMSDSLDVEGAFATAFEELPPA